MDMYIRIKLTILITLQPLSDLEWNGEPWGYKVFYKKTSDANFTSIIPHDSLILHRSNIAGLQEDLQYHVKMLAFNDVGEGPFCPIITTKTYKLDTSGKTFATFSCSDPEGGDRGSGPPLKNHKNIGFLSNTGLDPLKNYKATKPAFNVVPSLACQRNAIEMAFRWRADDGPILMVFESTHQLKQKKL